MSANPILQQKYNAIKGDKGTTALVQAIRENESGWDGKSKAKQNPYTLSHDAGTGFGAYGYQKSSWKQWAKDYAGDENLVPTPENQDMIAYLRVHDLKNQYGKAQDVLSVWNSGGPASQAKAGYNAQLGLNYDTPKYIQNGVNNFKKYYDSFSGPITKTGQSDTQEVNPLTVPDNTTGVDFKNARDAQMFAQKQEKYNRINQQAQQDMATGGAYSDIGTAGLRGVEGRTAELGTGLRRLLAKGTNAIGLENNLDPNSPTYNPILDRDSATSQLAKEQYFKVPKGTPGKAWATAFDVAGTLAPGAAAEKLALSAPTASKGLGILSGDSSVGKNLVSKVIGRNVADIPGLKGSLINTGVGLGTNILGGLAQTALKEGGINKKDVGQIAGMSAISHGLFNTLPAVAQGIRKLTNPEKAAEEFVKKYPNKAQALYEKGSQFVRDTLAKNKLKGMFGLGTASKEVEDDAVNAVTQYLPHLMQTDKGVDASDLYQAIQDDVTKLTDESGKNLVNFKGDVYSPVSMLEKAKQDLINENGGKHIGFLDEATSKIAQILKKAGPKKDNLSAQELHDLVGSLSTYEFAGSKPNVAISQETAAAESVFKKLARVFRKNARSTIASDIGAVSPEFGNKYNLLNSEIETKLNAADIAKAISKDPTAAKQFTDHMIGLASGLITNNPAAYVAGRALSKAAGIFNSKYKFSKTTQEPIIQEVGKLRSQLLDRMQKGEVPLPKGKIKLSDIINQK